MQLRHTSTRALVALCAILLTACLPSRETGPRLVLDANAVSAQREQIAQVLRTPILASLFDTSFAAPISHSRAHGAIDSLLARTGALLAARTAPRPSLARHHAGVAALGVPGSWLPAELRGKTYIRVDGAYSADDDRASEAPANGIRIVLYERLAGNVFGTTPIGHLDLADNSSGSKDIGSAKVVDASGATIASLTWTTETAGASSGTYTVSGTVGTTGKQIVIGDTIAINTATGGKSTKRIVYRSAAAFAGAELLIFTQEFDSDSSTPPFWVGVLANNHVMYAVPTELTETVVGTAIYIDDILVAINDPSRAARYLSPDGGLASPEIVAFIDAASSLASTMPLASLLADDASGMVSHLPR
jgi:hypothetical protein